LNNNLGRTARGGGLWGKFTGSSRRLHSEYFCS
jgi:hypothetical protein